MKFLLRIFSVLFFILFLLSCANIGRPTGGLVDVTPPKLIKSTPKQGELNFNKQKIELEFDEIVLIENSLDKVTISPPQINMPEISTNGRKVIVEIKDSLRKNSTYTIDFSDAIVDNNEKNPFNNFALSFSTGPTIDSLEVAGTLLNAADLEPVTGMYVGLHKLLDDSAFVKIPFDRTTRTDAFGKFRIRNIAAGRYRIYALKDANRDYKFDQPGEDIAFSDTIVVPSFTYYQTTDTIRARKKGDKDSLIQVKKTRFLPDNLTLRAFNENYKAQYLDKYDRKQRNKITLQFAAASKTVANLRPLNFRANNWSILERSASNDTLTYWLRDSTIWKQDTLVIEAQYLKTDSLKKLSPQTDTLKFVYHDPKVVKKKKKDDEGKVGKQSLLVDSKFGTTVDVYEDLKLIMSEPLDSIAYGEIRIEEKKDTIWHAVKAIFDRDSLNVRQFRIHYKWLPDQEYRLKIDSAAFLGIDGLANNAIKKNFKVKSLEQYSSLFFKIVGIKDNAFVELLNETDKVVRHEPVINGSAEFYYATPGSFYARLIVDRNKNSKWDTGNYAKKLQPEEVYYYNSLIELRPNWDVEQEWNVLAQPLESQKPLKLIKNKPKEKKPREQTDPKSNR